MVKLVQQDNLSAFSMDCSWLSDFSLEREHIVIANEEPMRIETIIHIKQYRNYESYIHALYALENLLSSQLPLYAINAMIVRALNKMITYKFNKHKSNTNERLKVPSYIEALFEAKCANITNIDIDCRQIFEETQKNNDQNNGCYSMFKSLLISQQEDWIKIELFCSLFPNLVSITVRCFKYLIFGASTCQRIINQVLKTPAIKSKAMFRVEFTEPNDSMLSLQEIVKKYYKSFRKLQYELLHVNEFTDSIIIRKSVSSKKFLKKRKQTPNTLSPEMAAHNYQNSDLSEQSLSELEISNANAKTNDDADCLVM